MAGSEKHQQPSISEGIIQVVSVTWRDLEYLPIRFEWTQTTGGPKLVCFCWVLILTYYCLQAMYNFLLKISGSNGGGAGSPSWCEACFCIGFPCKHRRARGFETPKASCLPPFFGQMIAHGIFKIHDELGDNLSACLSQTGNLESQI